MERSEAAARLDEHSKHCLYCNQGGIGCDRGRELEAARQSAPPAPSDYAGDLHSNNTEMMPLIEHYVKRECEAPATHQEMARETQEQFSRLKAALRSQPAPAPPALPRITPEPGFDLYGRPDEPAAPAVADGGKP